jgi:hypothetical protein
VLPFSCVREDSDGLPRYEGDEDYYRIPEHLTPITEEEADALRRPPPLTAEELAAAARAKRDALLAASDWTQLPDSPLAGEVRTAWATYRQALRDISDQQGFPQEIDWPETPGA